MAKTHLGWANVRLIYGLWQNMRDRCNNPNCATYASYGGRGITICERWNDFANFFADMGRRPIGHSLDRIDNDGPYSPENCRWATQKEQARNRRSNILVELYGRKMPMVEACEILGINYSTSLSRLTRGYPMDMVLSKEKLYKKRGPNKLKSAEVLP